MAGDGPEAVICHPSLGLGRFLFYRLIPPLSRHYTVISYDPRGVGENQALEPNLEDWVKDVGDLMALAQKPCHLVGVSLGTWVMARAAVRWPDAVRRLVLIGATPGFADGKALVESRRQQLAQTSMAEFARQYASQTLTAFAEEEVKEQLTADLQTQSAEAYLKAMAEIYFVDNVSTYAAVQTPTLVLVGSQDERTPPDRADAVAELLGHGSVRVVANAGHLALLDQPRRVAELIEEFLASGVVDD
ncbi:MAG: alpha/beta hydrolase [Sulfobacillus acidophilus]|uniref:Alpha/beta hydrolase n=1 Tax=Sulfobacillus acidophilus TaxID=53633 RepID=A0A2T2WJ52_9FIRM|nr:MAG: alpha/beta hydrolase [Sulfobacillus acidophilus]